MKKSSILAVKAAMQQRGGRATVRELIDATKLSSNTIRNAFFWLGATSDGYYPATWTLDPNAPEPVIDNKRSKRGAPPQGLFLEPIELPTGEVVPRWSKAQKSFSTNVLKALNILPDSKPSELAEAFLSAAATLATIGYRVKTEGSVPDWYETLGGVLEDSEQPDEA